MGETGTFLHETDQRAVLRGPAQAGAKASMCLQGGGGGGEVTGVEWGWGPQTAISTAASLARFAGAQARKSWRLDGLTGTPEQPVPM